MMNDEMKPEQMDKFIKDSLLAHAVTNLGVAVIGILILAYAIIKEVL